MRNAELSPIARHGIFCSLNKTASALSCDSDSPMLLLCRLIEGNMIASAYFQARRFELARQSASGFIFLIIYISDETDSGSDLVVCLGLSIIMFMSISPRNMFFLYFYSLPPSFSTTDIIEWCGSI